jgi:hypothetical protein
VLARVLVLEPIVEVKEPLPEEPLPEAPLPKDPLLEEPLEAGEPVDDPVTMDTPVEVDADTGAPLPERL